MAQKSQSLTVTFDVNSSNSNKITFLEHVMVPLSLRIQGQSRTVSFSDLIDALNGGVDLISYLETQRQSNHPKRGDIRVELTSPQATVSVLLPNRDYDFINDEGYSSWQFMSVHHWGEDPTGQWTLRVSFTTSSLTARIQVTAETMRLYGTTETPAAVASIPSTCHPYCARGCSGPTAADCDVCRDYRLNSTLECVTSCPKGTTEQNNYCTSMAATTVTDISSSSLNKAYFLINMFSISFAVALVKILMVN